MDGVNELDSVIAEFLVESGEGLDRMERDLVALERDPSNPDILGNVFRAIHSIKSTCGFLGYTRLETITHAGETLLSRLRDGELVLSRAIADALLALIDACRSILRSIETAKNEGTRDYRDVTELLIRLSNTAPDTAADTAAKTESPEPDTGADSQPRDGAETVRVDVKLLDRLMNMVGELVLVRNHILRVAGEQSEGELVATAQRLDLVTTELQESAMKTRMQPIGNVWSKFPRLVRDIGLQCGKRCRLEIFGSETEVDRTLLEAIKDPLTHLVKNAIDHGIESPEHREKNGKLSEGCVSLRAAHESGHVVIEVADDGAGIDLDRVRHKIVERGLASHEQTERMGEKEILSFLFAPGFSTAEQVTTVSGRGVGLDVVRANIEKVGGAVDIHHTPKRGTRFLIRIPLTLAIIPALVVNSTDGQYAIPQVNLVELVRVPAEEKHLIERVQKHWIFRLRGKLLPLISLRDLFSPEAAGTEHARETLGEEVNIVVVQADTRQYGLLVDSVHDTAEIVVKPLGKLLKGVGCFAGATITGEGRVALILDIVNIAQLAGVSIEAAYRQALVNTAPDVRAESGARDPLLVFASQERFRMAVPLSKVSRLEEFPEKLVEMSNGRRVVQYRGRILPLVSLAEVLSAAGDSAPAASDPLQVIVHSSGDVNVGVVVDRIIDIVDEEIEVHATDGTPGLLGSAVVQGLVTDLVDLDAVIRNAGPAVYRPLSKTAGATHG